MILILLLISVVILLYFVKPKNSENFRVAAMAIIGFAYFIVWRFSQYLSDIYFWEENTRFIVYTLIGLTATLICVLPGIRNIQRSSAIGLAVLFGVSVFAMFISENYLKNQLAIYTGYYDNPKPEFSVFQKNKQIREFKHEHAGYEFLIPSDWSLLSDKGKQFPYFMRKEHEKKQIEFRPKCNFDNDMPIPQAIHEIISSENQKQCFKWDEKRNACLVKTKEENSENYRWRLFISSSAITQGAELDFIFYEKEKNGIEIVESIMSSLKFSKGYKSAFSCLGIADWL